MDKKKVSPPEKKVPEKSKQVKEDEVVEKAEPHKPGEPFEVRLKKAAEAAEKAIEERFRVDRLLMEKDYERDRERFRMTISSLEDKVKEQGDRIRTLERDLKDLMTQSQAATVKMVEGIAAIVHRISPEQELPEEIVQKKKG